MQIYMVGGAVRDMVLGLEPHDKDYVVVGADAAEMTALGFEQVGKNFPVFLHPETKEEYALARKEIKTGDKHTDFKFVFDKSVTLQEDLERRDFTCNALVYDMQNHEIKDFVGGLKDIECKTLRHVNDAHFAEDPLRVLRMCRFAAKLDFDIAPETMALARQMVGDKMLHHLSAERIWQEFFKAFESGRFAQFVEAIRACGAMADLLPEVEKLWQTPERTDYHPEGNAGAHTLLALQHGAQAAPIVQFALLLHDIGKILTPAELLPRHIGHDVTGIGLIRQICRRLKVPNKYREVAETAAKNHMKFFCVPQMRIGTLRDFTAALTNDFRYDKNLRYLFEVCRCDTLGRAGNISDEALQQYEAAVKRCLAVFNRLTGVKATQMPNFAKLPKDAAFAARWREYQISLLGDL